MPPSDAKAKLRKELLERRRLAAEQRPDAGTRLADHWPAAWGPVPHDAVAGYWPLPGELDPRPLMQALTGKGVRLCLPRMRGPHEPLEFLGWCAGDALVAGRFGVHEPESSAPPCRPAIMLVPLVGVDLRGHRLGFGLGYYDRTLETLRAQGGVFAVGLAYAEQVVERLAVEAHDQPLDAVLTDAGVLDLTALNPR